VYLARDIKHDRTVALKVLRPELAAAMGADRFLREIKLVGRLQHPHILPLYDSGEADGMLFYVMPRVEGESLRDRLIRERQLPIDDAVRIAREISSALAHAHEHNVVHRDIKPENILLWAGHSLVADFGIARAISQAAGDALTTVGLTLGTPAYMSPEQAGGDLNIDGRSDIYSLGCVLYEMLAGEPPFTGPNTQTVIAKHLKGAPLKLRNVRPSVSEALERTVAKAMARWFTDRFQTARELSDALGSPQNLQTPAGEALKVATEETQIIATGTRRGTASSTSETAAKSPGTAIGRLRQRLSGAFNMFRRPSDYDSGERDK
jgi:serine/threonine protein kinase